MERFFFFYHNSQITNPNYDLRDPPFSSNNNRNVSTGFIMASATKSVCVDWSSFCDEQVRPYVRHCWPSSRIELIRGCVPFDFGMVVSPFSEIPQDGVHSEDVPCCESCGGVINLYCNFSDTKWICSICGTENIT